VGFAIAEREPAVVINEIAKKETPLRKQFITSSFL